MLIYDQFSKAFKNPYGSAPTGIPVHFRVEVRKGERPVDRVEIKITKEGESPCEYTCLPVQDEDSRDVRSFCFDAERSGLYFYSFAAKSSEGKVLCETPVYQLTVYDSEYETPDWLSGGLMYQIFPDRFARRDMPLPLMNKDWHFRENWGEDPIRGPDGNGIVKNNDFFGGNLGGIEDNLDYLAGLGVDIIYLNPIFEAYSNHRYDTADYKKIDPLLGTEEDFRSLCESAHARGMRVILDGVFNHTGSHSIYFNKDGAYDSLGAYQSKESPYYPWYTFIDYPYRYASWWGVDTLPAVNEMEPSYLEYMITGRDSVVEHWLSAGADGFRLDVADELPDGFLDTLRTKVKEVKPDACIIGEVWEDASSKIAYGVRRRYFQGKQLDSVMNYPLKDEILAFLTVSPDARKLAFTLENIRNNYPSLAFYSLMNILGTHDTKRLRTVLSLGVSQDRAFSRLRIAALIWAFLPGTACIYYGDEIGMTGGRDPMNRRCFEPEKAEPEIADFYSRLLEFRKSCGVLLKAPICDILGRDGVFSFKRGGETGRVEGFLQIAVNAGSEVASAPRHGEDFEIFTIGGAVPYEDGFMLPPMSGFCARYRG